MKSKAYIQFQKTTNRMISHLTCFNKINQCTAKNEFADVFDELKKNINNIDYSEIARTSIVLAVASMDTYYTDIFVEILVPYLKKRGCTDDLEDLLKKAGFTIKEALGLYTLDRPFRRIRNIVANYMETYVTQNLSVIDTLFKCYGIKHLSKHVESKCSRATMLIKINQLIMRRHKIVHQADLDRYGRLNNIKINDYLKNLADLEKFVSTSDEILLNLIL